MITRPRKYALRPDMADNCSQRSRKEYGYGYVMGPTRCCKFFWIGGAQSARDHYHGSEMFARADQVGLQTTAQVDLIFIPD